MALTMLTCGFGGHATIANKQVLLTSFSLSTSTNLVKSQGNINIWNGVDGKFIRMGTRAFKDHSTCDLSLTFDVTNNNLFNFIFYSCINKPHTSIAVAFTDTAYGISYSFSDAYLTNVNFTVSNGGLASVMMSFYVNVRDLIINIGAFLKSESGIGDAFSNLSKNVMPYWCFKADFTGFTTGDMIGFTWVYAQDVTPKFGCVANSGNLPSLPSKLIFSTPTVTFSVEYIIASSVEKTVDEYDYTHDTNNLKLYYINKSVRTTPFLTCENAVIDSADMSVANASNYQSMSVNGTVFGKITFSELL